MKLNYLLIFALFFLCSCGHSKENRDDIRVCEIGDSVIISEVGKFIEKTKGSRLYNECEFVCLDIRITGGCFSEEDHIKGVIYDSYITINYLGLHELNKTDEFTIIPCQKIAGKRIVFKSEHPTLGADVFIESNSVFREKLLNDVYPDRKKLNELIQIAENDFRNKNYPYSEVKFTLKFGEVLDSTYQFTNR